MQTVCLGFRPENKWTGFITRDSKSASRVPVPYLQSDTYPLSQIKMAKYTTHYSATIQNVPFFSLDVLSTAIQSTNCVSIYMSLLVLGSIHPVLATQFWSLNCLEIPMLIFWISHSSIWFYYLVQKIHRGTINLHK